MHLEVYPNKSGGWHWRRNHGDRTSDKSKAFDSRREAIETARNNRDPAEAVLLLRPDGSVYGELFHAERDTPPQSVSIDPAGETGKAV